MNSRVAVKNVLCVVTVTFDHQILMSSSLRMRMGQAYRCTGGQRESMMPPAMAVAGMDDKNN